MKYSFNKKIGTVCAIIEVHKSKGTTVNLILDFNIEKLRKRVGNFILDTIKKIKPDGNIISWKTSIGEFSIYKETRHDSWDIWKSKYQYIDTILQFAPKKGEIKNRTLSTRKSINPEYEGIDDCQNCGKESIIEYSIIRNDETLKVCKACKKFDNLLNKIEKQIELEKKIKRKRKK